MLKIYVSSIAIIIASSSFIGEQTQPGKELYEKNCSRCHGLSGTKHFLGAKDLQKSVLDDNSVLLIIQNGKRLMPSYKKKLSNDEIISLRNYIKGFKKQI